MRQKKDLSFSAAFSMLFDSLLLQLISIHLLFPLYSLSFTFHTTDFQIPSASVLSFG